MAGPTLESIRLSKIDPLIWSQVGHRSPRNKDTLGYWKLTDPLIDFTGKGDYWTIADACEGTQVFGGTGSGKTTGALQTIAKTFLLNGFGGLVLCAKIDEADQWEKYAKATGRKNDLIRLSESHFDFLSYESTRTEEVEVENIVNCFMEITEVSGESSGTNEAYWKRAGKQLMRNTVSLLLLGKEKITLNNISKLIASAPKDKETALSEQWQNNSYCYSIFKKIADERLVKSDCQKQEYTLAQRYLLNEYPSMDSRTRANIVSFFTTMADGFLRGKINEIFCTGKINITPELCNDGKIILVDLSIKEYQEVGRYAAVILKYMTQRYLERRTSQNKLRPVFIFADESHYFTTSKDQEFQTTARSSKACTVYATQNYPNYLKALNKKATVDSLLGNLQTKIFCQNGDAETNKWAAEAICKEIVQRKGTSEAVNISLIGGNMRKNKSTSEQKDFIIDPKEFTSLPKGGKINNCKVGAILWQSGKAWKNKSCYLKLKYKQIRQPQKGNGIFREVLKLGFMLFNWALFCLFCYGIYKTELRNIIAVIQYNISTTKSIYLEAGTLALGFGSVYLLINYVAYFSAIVKGGFILALGALAYFLYKYHQANITNFIFILNIYLIAFFSYFFLLKGETIIKPKWHTPIILRNR